jgi:hypothetical protein
MKFCFRTTDCHESTDNLGFAFGGLDIHELLNYLGTLKAGSRMHLIVRLRPGFDVEGKRNYFHGPMLTWICNTIKDKGIPCPREQMREELKKRFVGVDSNGEALSLADTLEVKTDGDPRDPEAKYGEFLSDVRNWCRDVLGSEPPRPDQVDLDEESNVCAIQETTL